MIMPSTKKKVLGFSLSCGCRDSKSVAVLEMPQLHSNTDLDDSISTTMASSSTWWEDKDREFSFSDEASATFPGLLRHEHASVKPIHSSPVVHLLEKGKRVDAVSKRGSGRVVGDSVAVVKESDDPLSDFRRSMVQMIVEHEIVEVEGLKELVAKYLALNSPEHHPAILRAFTEVWTQVFSQF